MRNTIAITSVVVLGLAMSAYADAGVTRLDRSATTETRSLAEEVARQCIKEIHITADETNTKIMNAAEGGIQEMIELIDLSEFEAALTLLEAIIEDLNQIAQDGASRIEKLTDSCIARLMRMRRTAWLVELVQATADLRTGTQHTTPDPRDPISIMETVDRETDRILRLFDK